MGKPTQINPARMRMQISGGLGNQTLGFIAGWQYAIQNRVLLTIDTSFYDTERGKRLNDPTHDKRDFLLNSFELPRNFDDSEVRFESFHVPKLLGSGRSLRSKIQNLMPSIFENYYISKDLHKFKHPEKDFRIFGDFLLLEYIDSALENGFKISAKNFESSSDSDCPSVIDSAIHLHMRFGDLIRAMPSLDLDRSYYSESINYFNQRQFIDRIYLYSDDLDLAYSRLKHFAKGIEILPASSISSTSPSDQFLAFSHAKNRICSNSSFSAVASRLAGEIGATVAPKSLRNIYGNFGPRENWIEINA